MFQLFFPDEYVKSAYEIPYEELYQKGIRGLLFDIDNTLVEHGKPATERAIALMHRLKEIGFHVCLISNNKEERVKTFNEPIQVEYIYKAGKPLRSGYEAAMRKIGTEAKTTVFIGDQLFTDVLGAKRTGIKSYLVEPIDPREEIQIVLKRYLEKPILAAYQRKKNRFGVPKKEGR
ncbi:MAG: YqeG family HAD IIIA-type phosphatase [Lachnospiraceae bacterium]|nr:YqeG family HAD IIIA-type phosphatase [Lachnospiraceae bacterium]